jgi:hypothetical protein
MPSTSEKGVCISWPGPGIRPAAASSWSMPAASSRSETQPFSLSSPFHAYTRSRNEVQNGSMTIISSIGCSVDLARAMK